MVWWGVGSCRAPTKCSDRTSNATSMYPPLPYYRSLYGPPICTPTLDLLPSPIHTPHHPLPLPSNPHNHLPTPTNPPPSHYSKTNPPPSTALIFTHSNNPLSPSPNSPSQKVLAFNRKHPVSLSPLTHALILHPASLHRHFLLFSFHLPKKGRYSLDPKEMHSVFMRRRTPRKNAGSEVRRWGQMGWSSAMSLRRTRQQGMRSVSRWVCMWIEMWTTVVSGFWWEMVQR